MKKKLAILLTAAMVFTSFTGFTYYSGFGNAYLDSRKEIFNGVTYNEQIGLHGTNGLEHAYFVDADTSAGTVKPWVFNGQVRSVATVGSMVNYAEQQGYKVLAAINGDLYDTATGTPKGLVIHGGNIVTSGYAPDRAIAFDSNGKASMQYVNLNYQVNGTIAYDLAQDVTTTDGVTTQQVQQVQAPFSSKVDYYNVPFGAAKGLHLFNRHYANSTMTAGSCIEVVVDCGSTDGMQLQVGKTIKGTVKAVNVDAHNTPIGENEVVLSTVSGSASASTLYCMVVGSEVEISVTDNNNTGLADATEAMGIYYSLLENGNIVTSGTNLNPRTAVGIKADGNVIIYSLDGRQSTVSNGLNLVDLANHMKSLGCVYAFNMDGGGSTAFYSRLPGIENTATRKNSPSEGSERKVANGLLFVYQSGNGGSSPEHLNLYPSLTLAMPGASVQINGYASNSLFEKTSLPGSLTYEVSGGNGEITSSGLFTAGENEGRVTITGDSGNISGTTEVEVVKSNLTITPSVTKLYIEACQTSDINMSVKSGPINVVSKDDLFTWSCDQNIGTIDQNGLFTAGNSSAQTGNIYIAYNGNTITIPVQVGVLTKDFLDTKDHWAKAYIGNLAARNILNGMGDNKFYPDTQLTRAQFLTILAKMVDGLDVSASAAAGFKDVSSSEWYYNYVNWGYEKGIVSGMSDTEFAPNANITREQMSIMLCKFAVNQGLEFTQTATNISFTDDSAINSWSRDYVYTIVGAGIMNGQPEGNFEPQGLATRAQAAKVAYMYLNLRDGKIN
ncbi:S-layer homology domain-containing protein [Clostridium aminobutyricum]|uniref:S-layer homology domain-containing protein n=1 Tax=Clostridium aminobutyricum TaxID=33953 RepID=A0A939D7T0_CLOAM|nr:S-layer homology domain-containing protein [Clostridium aminobutyricum]MBN7772388.1 S-layer homology domain-containing protein [Clostridium aminobutyricum]